ncbi:MAG: type II toxin-antitoxin system RelE/ParE family toxin [Spirochaetaceae bacterium]|jgi:plasmid stabilization system protein ParE|nr:type II toxin-antitoxin system RelE/ParE family toxin [Spirochaetaceae bacterium]
MIEKYFIKWAAPAREDLNEIIEHIAQTNITYAVKILDRIELAIKKLDMSPKRGRIVPELERYGYILYREIIVDYWRIMYKIEKDIVYIMIVIDGRRNVEDIILKKIITRENEL